MSTRTKSLNADVWNEVFVVIEHFFPKQYQFDITNVLKKIDIYLLELNRLSVTTIGEYFSVIC